MVNEELLLLAAEVVKCTEGDFYECLDWLREQWGDSPVKSAVLHCWKAKGCTYTRMSPLEEANDEDVLGLAYAIISATTGSHLECYDWLCTWAELPSKRMAIQAWRVRGYTYRDPSPADHGIERQIKDLQPGETGYVVAWAMYEGSDGESYLHGHFDLFAEPSGQAVMKIALRMGKIFVFDLPHIRRPRLAVDPGSIKVDTVYAAGSYRDPSLDDVRSDGKIVNLAHLAADVVTATEGNFFECLSWLREQWGDLPEDIAAAIRYWDIATAIRYWRKIGCAYPDPKWEKGANLERLTARLEVAAKAVMGVGDADCILIRDDLKGGVRIDLVS